MINFKITGTDGLTIFRPSGKEMSLKVGEIVRANVMEILPSGGVSLSIKGNTISARTEVPLEKGSAVFFRVLNTPSPGQDLRLHYMGRAEPAAKGQTAGNTLAGTTMNRLLQDLSASLLKSGAQGAPATLQVIESIIRELPADLNALSPETKVQLQSLLQASLRSAGQNIQSRVDALLGQQLPGAPGEQPAELNRKQELMVAIEKMLGTSLKEAVENTGVAFEAKLKSSPGMPEQGALSPLLSRPAGSSGEAQSNAAQDALSLPGLPDQEAQNAPAGSLVSGQEKENAPAEKAGSLANQGAPAIRHDLKAGLLQLKELLETKGREMGREMGAPGTAKGLEALSPEQTVRNLSAQIDGLLRDIETFQLLSKTNDSFYTFLPVRWQELRDGEVEFKRGRGDGKGNPSCSCRMQLDLEQSGSLSVMVLLHNKEFYVSFRADDPGFQADIGAHLEELKESFSRKGLRLTSARMIDSTQDSPLEQFGKMSPPPGIVDIEA
ncbi:MAG: flagellar hook-length control protein FliK [Thermodesulfovibrionales bacterium]